MMYYRGAQSMNFDSDGLQADVMRFMAIIAFCLIAILTLAQKVEQVATEPVETRPVETKPTETKPVEEHIEMVATFIPVQELETQAAPPDRFVPEPAREPLPELEPVFRPEPAREPIPEILHAALIEEVPEALPETVKVVAPEMPEKKSLALRFASDDTFLNLISSDAIQLFAHVDQSYFKMASNFSVTETQPSGALYELLPTSIPARITRIFDRSVAVENYLVALPGATRAELNNFLQNMSQKNAQGGTLIIHRDGHLSYEN